MDVDDKRKAEDFSDWVNSWYEFDYITETGCLSLMTPVAKNMKDCPWY